MTTFALAALILGLVPVSGHASARSAAGRSPSAQASSAARASSDLDPETEEPISVAGYPLYAAPPQMRTKCRRAQARVRFRVLCATRLPRAKDGTRPRTYAEWADSHEGATRADWLYVGAGYSGSTDPEHWEWNDPDLFLHFVVFEGRLTPELIELSGTRYPQKLLGTRTLGGRRGKLYEQVCYAVCGCGLGGHYTFLWRENGTTYAASLHRWLEGPTLRALAALILHLGPV